MGVAYGFRQAICVYPGVCAPFHTTHVTREKYLDAVDPATLGPWGMLHAWVGQIVTFFAYTL